MVEMIFLADELLRANHYTTGVGFPILSRRNGIKTIYKSKFTEVGNGGSW